MNDLRQQALDYHQFPTPGKIGVTLTTLAETSLDLSLAYSPGVAEPVLEIAADPDNVYKYTNKGNTVAQAAVDAKVAALPMPEKYM